VLGRADHSAGDAWPKAAAPLADDNQPSLPSSRKLDDPRCGVALEDLARGHHVVSTRNSEGRIQCLSMAEELARQPPLIVGDAQDRRGARTDGDENERRDSGKRKIIIINDGIFLL